MKINFIKSLFFVLCFEALSSLAHERTFTQKHGGSKLSELRLGGKQLQGLNVTMELSGEDENAHIVTVKKAKQGIHGGGGNSDLVRRPRNSEKSGASFLLERPFYLLYTTLVEVGSGLVIVSIFFL